jgi:hypothetical protein
MLAHSGVQNLSPFLELLLVDFAARKALWRMSRGVFTRGTPDPTWLGLSAIREALKQYLTLGRGFRSIVS